MVLASAAACNDAPVPRVLPVIAVNKACSPKASTIIPAVVPN